MDSTKDCILYETCSKEIVPIAIKSSQPSAEAETRVNLLNDAQHKDFANSLQQRKPTWKIPWFILIMCLIQVIKCNIILFCKLKQLNKVKAINQMYNMRSL